VNQTLLLTHTDLDGLGCAVLVAGTISDSTVQLVENGVVDDKVREAVRALRPEAGAHHLLITDHGVDATTAALIDDFIQGGGECQLLDHHRSSARLAGRPWATIDESHSATGLLYEHMGRPERFAEFVGLVEDHDLWQHRDERSSRLATLAWLLGSERFLARFCADPTVQFRESERLLLDIEEGRQTGYLDKKVRQARVAEIGGVGWALCYAEQYQSDLAERLMTDRGVQATAIINPGKRTVSLRGRNVDVSRVAERFGGGGHARAAAFCFVGTALEGDLLGFEVAMEGALRALPSTS
jgi:oligoribonuclease NrnB/cAMP/cGMP phosphodiesterase (DHH superfamily)